MEIENRHGVILETSQIRSFNLDRTVIVDCYFPNHVEDPALMSLLLINDGQDMEKLGFISILDNFFKKADIAPIFCVGIHAGPERKMEYGTAETADYKGRGAKAKNYGRFVMDELLPFVRSNYQIFEFREKAFAGFSLGGLSALDIVWNHPHEFNRVGIFSGSFWWRTKDKLDLTYNEETDRIMQNRIRSGDYHPWLKFFFECGTADEQEDRNQNGVIDSIDDTQDIIRELLAKGYAPEKDIVYLELDGGKHDIPTWGLAMPVFLDWGWGR
jgi:enterochelin esterase-like enzyme